VLQLELTKHNLRRKGEEVRLGAWVFMFTVAPKCKHNTDDLHVSKGSTEMLIGTLLTR